MMCARAAKGFEFVDDTTGFRASNCLVARLGGRLRRKQDVLRELDRALKFPDYFGWNWDALDECLRDLSWLGAPEGVVILHKRVPLADESQRQTYLDILRQAQKEQRIPLRVVFPESGRSEIEN
jgi:hypothetical protein